MCLKKDPSVRSSSADLLSHPFIEGVTDFRPLRVLYQERRAEVVEVVEDLPEDADIMHREIQHVVRARGEEGRREEGGQTGSCMEGGSIHVHSTHLCRKRHSPSQNLRLLPQKPLPPQCYHQMES